jgi:hypothetical protein
MTPRDSVTTANKQRDATAAWRTFVACVEAMPADQAAPLWQVVNDRVTQFVKLQPHGHLQPHGA